jgi:hypothetical protein
MTGQDRPRLHVVNRVPHTTRTSSDPELSLGGIRVSAFVSVCSGAFGYGSWRDLALGFLAGSRALDADQQLLIEYREDALSTGIVGMCPPLSSFEMKECEVPARRATFC